MNLKHILKQIRKWADTCMEEEEISDYLYTKNYEYDDKYFDI